MGTYLIIGDTKSCGCYNIDKIKQVGFNNAKQNKYIFYDNMALCYTEDYTDCWIFDPEDYDKIQGYYWHNNGKDYAMAKIRGTQNNIYMHRLIDGCDDPALEVDHFNHNRHDNRKENLRRLTPSENQHTKGLNKNNTSGITGISYCKRDHEYQASVAKNGITYFKAFKDKEDAIKWRINISLELYGDKSPYHKYNEEKIKS